MTFFIVLMVVTGCSSSDYSSELQVNFLQDGATISTEGFQTYSVELKDKDGKAIDVEQVYMYMNMEMMNHPIEGTMNHVGKGVYELDLPLAMSGDWYVNLSVTFNGETTVLEGFSIFGEGEKQMEWMKGYHADDHKQD